MKYYAVVNGVKPGIYTDWPTTQSMVSGYSSAIFKSFSTREEAELFIEKSTLSVTKNIVKSEPLPLVDKTIIYTDGSFKQPYCGFGVVILRSNGKKTTVCGRVPSSVTDHVSSVNVAELYAIYVALSLIPGDIVLYSDSIYCVGTLTSYVNDYVANGWSKNIANKELIRACYELMCKRSVTLIHVDAHCGIAFNEECDRLASYGRNQEEPLIIFEGTNRI